MKRFIRCAYALVFMISFGITTNTTVESLKPLETVLTKVDKWQTDTKTAITKDMVTEARTELKTASKTLDKAIDQANEQLDGLEKRAKKGGFPEETYDQGTLVKKITDISDTVEEWFLDTDTRISQELIDKTLAGIKSLESAYSKIEKRLQNKKYTGMLDTAKDQLKDLAKRSEKDIQQKNQSELTPKITAFSSKVEKWYNNKTMIVKDADLNAAQIELKSLEKEYDKVDKKVKDKKYTTMLDTASTQLKEISKRAAQVGQKKSATELQQKINAQSTKINGLHKNTKTVVDKKTIETMSTELKNLEKAYDKIDKELRDKKYTDMLSTAQKQLKEIEKRAKK